MTVEDVVKSLNLHRSKTTLSTAKTVLENIKLMTVQNASEILVELTSPYADFPYQLADYHLNIMPFDGEN